MIADEEGTFAQRTLFIGFLVAEILMARRETESILVIFILFSFPRCPCFSPARFSCFAPSSDADQAWPRNPLSLGR